jgi:hypothetical protein
MGWVLFEVLLAFGLAVFIVWWTFPKKKKSVPVSKVPTPAPPVAADNTMTSEQDGSVQHPRH